MPPYKRKLIHLEEDHGGCPSKKRKVLDSSPYDALHGSPKFLPSCSKSISAEYTEFNSPSNISPVSYRGETESSTEANKMSDACRDGAQRSSVSAEVLLCTNISLSQFSSSGSRYTLEEYSSTSSNDVTDDNILNDAMILEETIEDSSDSASGIEIVQPKTNILPYSTLNCHSNIALHSLVSPDAISLSDIGKSTIDISGSSLNNAMRTEKNIFEKTDRSLHAEENSLIKTNSVQKKALTSIRQHETQPKEGRICKNSLALKKEDFSIGYREDQEIPFKWMLCNRNFWEKVPLDNIFNRLPKGDEGVHIIMEDIMKMNTGISFTEITSNCLMDFTDLVSIIRKIIQQWKKLSLPHLANHFCEQPKRRAGCRDYTSPDKCVFKSQDILQLMSCAPPAGKDVGLPGTPTSEEELLKQEVEKMPQDTDAKGSLIPLGWQQVYALLITVLMKVVPFELWGSSHNQKIMFKAVKTVIKLGCHDKLFLGHVIRGVKHKHFRWALRLRRYCHYTHVIAKVWLWILRRLIMTVIHALFYVTETAVRRNQLLFFRKRIWQCVHNKGISNLLQSNFCSILSHSEARALKVEHGNNCKGVIIMKSIPCLRFLPKAHGVRPIIPAGMAGLSRITALHCRLLLREMMKVYECGSWRVRALSALHSAWANYFKRVYLTGESKPLYFVRVDVQDAYGSINHETLKMLIQKGISNLPSILKFGCYSALQCSSKAPSQKSYILLDETGQPTSPLVRGGYPLVQCGEPLKVHTGQLTPSLMKTVTLQIAKVTQRQCVRANRGVPQGGSLSGALCELYYSAMCALHLVNFNKDDSIILRSVDDFLYVTPSSSQASAFLTHMRKGFPDFNCFINERKTQHNLQSGCGQRVAFRGIVMCSESRQILVDGASLSSGLPRYSLRLNKYKSPGQLVALRLQQVSLARLPQVVLDPTYTKPTGLIANVWRAGFMAGARLISLIAALLVPQGPVNTAFIAQSVAKVGGSVCTRVTNTWAQAGKSLPFVKEVIILVYVGAVCSILRMPYIPTWSMLNARLKGFIKRLLMSIPEEQYHYLPKLPRHVLRA
ncbi:telomerase reverse transcriptase-like [Penaeus chinensis]|uniref:telomerase reverse transcriptase-like n=1 Tax=Penaeus chinensis TaxID=139456 RepID=UPI001FB59661|nr:telomerase reverse transcriptase-like [Penaeus chinensis]XP_047484010.1 telomerase reverse transcriptase-like [Penaeus chinensis]XP_047484011.1 telomerase reverse transcriptase-like [Penaeus chinensis]